ncbi:hypothetical protein CXF34_06180 [Corynebacterium bovis]|nr:hypothetical protein CXF31_04050 [Corynebacterium bovis]RRQ09690.1 hypothetical protein CXF34_06180 [Corynebacterium bovis]
MVAADRRHERPAAHRPAARPPAVRRRLPRGQREGRRGPRPGARRRGGGRLPLARLRGVPGLRRRRGRVTGGCYDEGDHPSSQESQEQSQWPVS